MCFVDHLKHSKMIAQKYTKRQRDDAGQETGSILGIHKIVSAMITPSMEAAST